MFLKSIEIRGFKSFADKTELNFKKGVTAVVGPNGSGKSNISDAVRWVLGEQSAKSLRGGKMEDVIFAGTQFRKPVGLAQVSLTLDNSSGELPIDYSDITITRRIFRSGESEYLINNTNCRLKDIHELFMDTGIGKEGYSIIGQGKIDAILSGKPEERRGLLEEAAGIVKYKSRKEEAEKKLQNTEQNLIRIKDILNTYEERLEPLRVESEKAMKFVDLSNELNSLEISFITDSIKRLKNSIDTEETKIKDIKLQMEEVEYLKGQLKNDLENKNHEMDKHESFYNEAKNEYYSGKSKCQEYEYEIQILKEKILNIKANIQRNNTSISELENTLLKLKESKEFLDKDLQVNQNNQASLEQQILELEKKVLNLNESIGSKESLSENLRTEAIELLRNASGKKNKCSLLQSDYDKNCERIKELENQIANNKDLAAINLNTVSGLNKSIEGLNSDIVDLENNILTLRKKLKDKNLEKERIEKELKEKNIKYNKLEANYTMLSNLEKQYEGYNRAVKTLVQHAEKDSFIVKRDSFFVLGDIIKVQKEHETAIEISLGGSISDIITIEEETAKLLIKYLKNNSLGRATFLPLSIIRGRKLTINDNIKSTAGYIGIASELIEYDSKFNNAIQYVLGRTVICSDMDSALLVAKKSSYSFKIVTLAGEVVNVGGALTGGSNNYKNTSIISRKRELEDTLNSLENTKVNINLLTENLQTIKNDYKNIDDAILSSKDEIHYKNIDIVKLREKISSVDSEANRIKSSLKVSEKEITDISNKNSYILKDIQLLEESIHALSKKENENKESLSELDKFLTSQRNEINEVKQNLTELKIKKAQADEIVSGRINELVRISQELESNNNKIVHFNDDIDLMAQEKLKHTNEIQTLQSEIDVLKDSMLKMEKDFQSFEFKRVTLKDEIKAIQSQLEDKISALQKQEEQIHKFEIAKARFEMEKESILKRLNEEMNLTYAEAEAKSIAITDMDYVKRTIKHLKESINLLGNVNVGAIEEYKEISEKYSFMSSQQEDLINAKNELLNVINEMTEKMRHLFSTNFKILKENFNETFKLLFKGGSGDLILSEGDELTANIEINVQPPGKKLQNINLMSGGEKVLSAIALLFAILKMKPTPFCILDEIEAALDDSNVYRYAEFMKSFSQRVQFIVITHRKGTMEACDVLYGITMEEKGVSKVVSLDLSKK
ncbi:chromosome segregation protein SMC [Clostridium polynesiense]|uniref:chromosome segregation protein SMC n=1 Tax=Clostridium polynesiense TaxID=1325933 RepID=UPI00058D14FC|nr:chromosome segregation protein SMC [Clostridium polynesiense]